MKAEISVTGLEELRGKLSRVERQAVRQSDTDYVAEQIRTAILLRTQRGEFLSDSTGTGYSDGHKRRREKLGLQTSRVDLFMGQVGVLESLRARSGETGGGNVVIETGYIAGLSEARAAEIGKYLDTQGAGKNRITYKHIGLTSGEQTSVLEQLKQRILNHLNNELK